MKLKDMRGPSIMAQMKAVLALKWASGKQPKPIQKFRGHTEALVTPMRARRG